MVRVPGLGDPILNVRRVRVGVQFVQRAVERLDERAALVDDVIRLDVRFDEFLRPLPCLVCRQVGVIQVPAVLPREFRDLVLIGFLLLVVTDAASVPRNLKQGEARRVVRTLDRQQVGEQILVVAKCGSVALVRPDGEQPDELVRHRAVVCGLLLESDECLLVDGHTCLAVLPDALVRQPDSLPQVGERVHAAHLVVLHGGGDVLLRRQLRYFRKRLEQLEPLLFRLSVLIDYRGILAHLRLPVPQVVEHGRRSLPLQLEVRNRQPVEVRIAVLGVDLERALRPVRLAVFIRRQRLVEREDLHPAAHLVEVHRRA